MKKINPKQIISIILTFTFIATSMPYADVQAATYAKLSPQSRIASQQFQEQFVTQCAAENGAGVLSRVRLWAFANYGLFKTRGTAEWSFRGLRIKLEGPLFEDEGIMKVIMNSRNEMSIFEGPNFEYIFILGGKETTAPAISKKIKSNFRLIGHNHPRDADTGFVQFMPSKGDLDTNEGRRLFIISPFGIIWYEVARAAIHSNLFDVFKSKIGDRYFGELLVRAAHTDFETVRAFYKLMMVDVSFEPRNGTRLVQDPAKALFALAREEGFYKATIGGRDSIESLYGQATKLLWQAQAARDAAVVGRASSHIEKKRYDDYPAGMRRVCKILIRTWEGSKKNTGDYPKEVEARVNVALDRLFYIYGPVVTNKIKGIVIMPHLRGGSLAELRRGVLRIDETVIETNSMELLFDVIEHEFWHMILEDIKDAEGKNYEPVIQEMVAIFQSLSRFRDANYDVEDWMEGSAGEGAALTRVEDTDAYQGRFLESLKAKLVDKRSGIDPRGEAARLYKEARDIFAKARLWREDVVGPVFENIAMYIFTRGGYEKEKEGLRLLHGGSRIRTVSIDETQRSKTDIIRCAKEALKRLDRKREQFMVERYLTAALEWKDILRISSLSRTVEAADIIVRELRGRIDAATRELGFSDFSHEEKGGILEVVIAEALWRKAGLVRALAERVSDTKDSGEAKRRIQSLATDYGLTQAEFEYYRDMIMVDMALYKLFRAIELVRDPKSGEGVVRIIFENDTARIGETTTLKLPIFLNELWELLDGCAIDIATDTGEEELQLFIEDLIKYARLDPIGAYLDISGVEAKLPWPGFLVVDKETISAAEEKAIERTNQSKKTKRIFVIDGTYRNANMILDVIKSEAKAAKPENVVFVVSDVTRWGNLAGFKFFKAEGGAGLNKIVKLANCIITDGTARSRISDMIKGLDPALYRESLRAGAAVILEKAADVGRIEAAQDAKTKLATHGKLKIIPGAELKGGDLTTRLEAKQQVRVMP